MKIRSATKRNRRPQLESLECRTVLSAGMSGLSPVVPSSHAQSGSPPAGHIGAYSPNPHPTAGSTFSQRGSTNPSGSASTGFAPHQNPSIHARPTNHFSGNPGSPHRPNIVQAGDRAVSAVGRSVLGLNAAVANLQRVEANAPAAAAGGLNRALSRIERAGLNLDRSLTVLKSIPSPSPSSSAVLKSATTGIKQAVAELQKLQGKVPAARLSAVQAVLNHALSQTSTSPRGKV